MRTKYSIFHPWPLIFWKIILYLANELPISYKRKLKVKEKVFHEKFPLFARNNFKIGKGTTNNFDVYNIGPFQISIRNVAEHFPLNNLEMNIACEFLNIIYPAFNHRFFKSVLGEGPYEINDIFLEKGDYVVDAGANLGIFTFLASQKVGDKGHIFAFEPVKFFITCLEESIKTNSSENISLLELALGNEDKNITFYLSGEDPSVCGKFETSMSNKSLTVEQVKLDTLVFEKKMISKVNFLKMDIEGSERDALAGAKETVFTFSPKLAICTYHLKDDPVILSNIIKSINPKYKIHFGRKKLYARV
jgi:FkbM family methyltransferase